MNEAPLDTDLSSVDTSFPVIAAGQIVDFAVTGAEVMTNDSNTLKLELTTTGSCQSTKGDSLPPGVKIFHTVNLKPTGKSNWDIVMRGAAQLIQGLKMTGVKIGDLSNDWAKANLIGKTPRLRVGVEAEGTGKDGKWRPARNNVAEWIKN